MFWLRGKDGETPPSFCQDNMRKENYGEDIAKFGFSIIQGSLDDVSCDKHKEIVPECKDCEEILSLVKSYQTQSHRFSCYKKKKHMKILPNEGYHVGVKMHYLVWFGLVVTQISCRGHHSNVLGLAFSKRYIM